MSGGREYLLSLQQLIWIRIGDNGSIKPFETYANFSVDKKEPVIRECLRQYWSYLLKNELPIKEPIKVVVTRLAKNDEDAEIEGVLDYKLSELEELR